MRCNSITYCNTAASGLTDNCNFTHGSLGRGRTAIEGDCRYACLHVSTTRSSCMRMMSYVLYSFIESESDCIALQEDLNKLTEWADMCRANGF